MKIAMLPMLLAASIAVASAAVPQDGERQWQFRVLLDDDPIGRQTFRVREDGARRTVAIEAAMDVKLLFLTVYSYRHTNRELWEDGCLASIESSTDDNGTAFRVRGRRTGDGFVVEEGEATGPLPACVATFAYWDPIALRASTRLLNSQTGEYQDVAVRELGEEVVMDGGAARRARRVALEGETLRIDLWYGDGDEWLALESRTKDGRTIRYVRE